MLKHASAADYLARAVRSAAGDRISERLVQDGNGFAGWDVVGSGDEPEEAHVS